MRRKNLFWLFLLITIIIIFDQWSKYIVHERFYLGESIPVIKGFFNLTYVRNSGAAFGFGGAFHDYFRYILFLGLPVLACAWLLALIYKNSNKKINLMTFAYTLILAGAVGNLIDRFRLGFVVDMFDFYQGSYHFATFNVADASISVAAFFLVIDFLFHRKKSIGLKNT